MKRFFLVFLIMAVLTTLFANTALVQAAGPPAIHAETAALVDVTSGRLLYSRSGDKQMLIASLTKVMTAIVAIERGRLTDQVTVSKNAFGKEGSSIYLKLGEQISLHYLLYGLMLRSGNDAATAIAEHVGGSQDGFVYMMNEKAQELGMSGSHFANPSGLDQTGHYSTANDLAVLTAYALKNPVFQEIVKTDVKKVPDSTEKWDRVWYNKNKMLTLYQGADGVKTGYTKTAKRCLITSATRGGQQLAVVTLNDPEDWIDHRKLLDYGFAQYRLRTLVQKGDAVQDGFVAGSSLRYALTDAENGAISHLIEWEQQGSVRSKLGLAGKLKLQLAGKVIGEVPIYPVGSPLLKQKDDSAFRYRPPSSGRKLAGSFKDNLFSVIRALFFVEVLDR